MADCGCELEIESAAQAHVLWILLAINGAMFLAEFGAGIVAEPAALVADSFDMLADAAVYAVSLRAFPKLSGRPPLAERFEDRNDHEPGHAASPGLTRPS